MWKPLSLLLFFVGLFNSYSQEIKVYGTIMTREKVAVSYANIIISDGAEPSKPITFGYSDQEGKFSFTVPYGITILKINVSAIGFQEKSISLNVEESLSKDIILEESITSLEEVVLKARPKGDTLNLGIHDMNLTDDKTLRDMLNKTDGIIISREGGIMYRGKQIDKILINGKEVFIKQNKIALDNLDYDMMKSVQVIDNYKDRFAIDFNPIRDPVINVETKDEFKGILKAEAEVGYGFDNKYNLTGKGFLFSDKLNAFITSNTTNTGEIVFNQKDISAPIIDYSTNVLRNYLQPFFIEDFQTSKNFVSNTSLTLRKEAEKNKSGLVVYYGNTQIEREVIRNTFLGENKVETSRTNNNQNGNFISGTANFSAKLSKNTVFENKLSTLALWYKDMTQNLDTVFSPIPTSFNLFTKNTPRSLALSNELQITKLLTETKALDLELNYYYENDKRDLDTQQLNVSSSQIVQIEDFSKNYFSALSRLKFDLKPVYFNVGLGVSYNQEKGKLIFENDFLPNVELERKITIAEIPFNINGSIGKLDYSLSAVPTLIHTDELGVRDEIKSSNRLTYNFETQNNLILSWKRNYRFFNLNSLYDTIVRAFNVRVINDQVSIEDYTTSNVTSLEWNNNNVARNKQINFKYEFTRDQNVLLTVLDSISNNTFFYANQVFESRNTHLVDLSGRKGFYFSPSYHLIYFGADLYLRREDYPTITNLENVEAKSMTWEPALNLTFRPRGFLIREASNQLKWNNYTFSIDEEEVNSQSILTNILTVEGTQKKIDWEFDFIYQVYNVNSTKFDVPDFNLSVKYRQSDKLSFSLSGRSLFTLFDLNNFNFVNTQSNGNILTQTFTSNNLGYLLFNTSFKL
jgi:hypothetical protein